MVSARFNLSVLPRAFRPTERRELGPPSARAVRGAYLEEELYVT
jgi:hypothetical protein